MRVKLLGKKLLLFLLPPLGSLFLRILYFSCRKKFILPKSLPQEPFIVAFWHGELLMQPFLYKKVRKEHKIAVMISEHFDGEIIARVIKSFNFDTVRGSPKKGGAKALIRALRLVKEGYDIAITPDGPRGPRFSVAPGIVMLSQKANIYIVPFRYKASSYWELNSWDRFIVPKPFSKLTFYIGKPFKLNGMSEEEAKAFIKDQMVQYPTIKRDF